MIQLSDRWRHAAFRCPRCGMTGTPPDYPVRQRQAGSRHASRSGSKHQWKAPEAETGKGGGRKGGFGKWVVALIVLMVVLGAAGWVAQNGPPDLTALTAQMPWLAKVGIKPQTGKEPEGAWDTVWASMQGPPVEARLPADLAKGGAPMRRGCKVLFRYAPPPGTDKVYLAGSFNKWAQNRDGKVEDEAYAMTEDDSGVWFRWVDLPEAAYQYQYVVLRKGIEQWVRDPDVSSTDRDGNTDLDFATVTRMGPGEGEAAARPLKTTAVPAAPALTLPIRLEKVWVKPGESNSLIVTVPDDEVEDCVLVVAVETPLGELISSAEQPCIAGENRIDLAPVDHEGGFPVHVSLEQRGERLKEGEVTETVVRSVADDLRYGFYARYPEEAGDYSAKANMLEAMNINAVEFFDYFRAHGEYAPREKKYVAELFNVPINAEDVARKVSANRERNILSLAYVAAYAASPSVYAAHPYPMTDENGSPKIFNGVIMTEAEADRENKPKWLRLMNVAADSPWTKYILGEFRRTLSYSPDGIVAFDGFELDTYGDTPGTLFYAARSGQNAAPLSMVLHDFAGRVNALTHEVRPDGLVSFNSVNEFGVDRMRDVTDFLFIEVWRAYAERLDQLVEICYRNRAPTRERVILKMYPADMEVAESSWPEYSLRRLLGAAMTGGGSLMVAGEPDETTHRMCALNTLYYPDAKPMPPECEAVLRAYYRQDAMLLGYTHGREVYNADVPCDAPGCVTRAFAAPPKRCVVVQLLRTTPEDRWGAEVVKPDPLMDAEVSMETPAGTVPKAVYYMTPDVPGLQRPAALDFDVKNGRLRTLLPELMVHGTLIVQY